MGALPVVLGQERPYVNKSFLGLPWATPSTLSGRRRDFRCPPWEGDTDARHVTPSFIEGNTKVKR
ncbi:hypothetical protein N9L68_04065 [bacterium]|nr:hypothetical protein [bacterium]